MASINVDKKICSTCFHQIAFDKTGVTCVMCGRCFHAKNTCIKSPLTCQQTEIDTCHICLSNSLPFNSIDPLDFNFTFGDFSRLPSEEDMDKLMRLKFNPFDTKHTSIGNDDYDMLTNINNISCKYYLPNDISRDIPSNEHFSILNLNIRSIINKFDSLKYLLKSLKHSFSIISLTETWLDNENCTDYKLDNFNFVSTNRNKKKGGGVGMFISNDLNFKFRPDLDINEEGIIESLFIEIITTIGKNIIVGTLYRPPNGKFEIFETNLNKILSKVDKSNKVTYFMGDFNIDLLKSESCDFSNRFSEQFSTSSFFPLITRPTRITEHTATLIDNIFTNDLEQIEYSKNGLIFTDISDHLPIFHIASLTMKKHNSNLETSQHQRTINNDNLASFLNSVKDISWDFIFENNDACESYNSFHNNIILAFEKSFPLAKRRKRTIDYGKSPWMTQGISKSIEIKNRLYKKCLKNPSKKNQTIYKNYKNKLKHLIKITKKDYFENQFIKYKNNNKMTWQTINRILNRNKERLPDTFQKKNSDVSFFP